MNNQNFKNALMQRLKTIYKMLENEDAFFINTKELRFYLYKDFFMVYAECVKIPEMKEAIALNYESDFFKIDTRLYDTFCFIRNLLIHFPIFSFWDEVYFSNQMINWNSKGKSIDQYLRKYGNMTFYELYNNFLKRKVRAALNNMTQYDYVNNKIVFLKDIIDEHSAVRLFNSVISEIIYIVEIKCKV